jgi:alpha-galactosidase
MSLMTALMLAALVEGSFLLETDNTAMAFKKDARGVWTLLHYGEKPAASSDAEKLAWSNFVGFNEVGQRVPATYCAFGQKLINEDVNKFGGLTVTHSDGVITTDLIHEKAEIVPDKPGVTHLVLTLKDSVYPFRVLQHFRAISDCDVIETWVDIVNGEKGAVKLVKMPSAALLFPNLAEEYHLTSLTGTHYCEGRLVESELTAGRTATLGARSGIFSSWGAVPAFMLGIGAKPTENSGRVIGGALCWSGTWTMEFEHDFVHHITLRAGVDTSSGSHVLDAGKSITLPPLVLTHSSSGKGQISRNLHRWARNWRMPNGGKLRPIPLCSWAVGYSFDGAKLEEMMHGTADLGCELFVLDDGWFGSGKYARDPKHGDRVGLGDWYVNRELIPQGLDGLAAKAKELGIGFGIWVEPEMVNTNSWLYEAHPDWALEEKTRPPYARRGGSQRILDMMRGAVRENIFNQLDKLFSGIPGLAYVKWDANATFSSLGSATLPPDRQANVWFDYTKGLEELLGKVRAKYPALDLQCCASGGGRMDYGFLKYADEFWASDNVDPRERVLIQWGASQFFPASAIASHIAPCPNWHLKRTTPIKYRCDVAMSVRYGFEFDPKAMSKEEFEVSKRATEIYKSIRPTVQQGDLYRLVSPFEKDYAALMYVNETKTEAVVFVYGLSRSGFRDGYPAQLRLEGLDTAAEYSFEELNPDKKPHTQLGGKSVSGKSLMAMGLPIRLNQGDWDSAIFRLKAQ